MDFQGRRGGVVVLKNGLRLGVAEILQIGFVILSLWCRLTFYLVIMTVSLSKLKAVKCCMLKDINNYNLMHAHS